LVSGSRWIAASALGEPIVIAALFVAKDGCYFGLDGATDAATVLR